MMEIVFRQARSRDFPTVKKILRPWCDEDRHMAKNLDEFLRKASDRSIRCNVMETDRNIRSVCLWAVKDPTEVGLLALGSGHGATELDLETRHLREEILEWAQMGVHKVSVELPEALSPALMKCLRECGFIFEGITSSWSMNRKPRVKMSKHFLYRTVLNEELMGFLQEFMGSRGYEVRSEEDGFRYRVREDFRLPFIFSSWHRITTSGTDIVVHPPARVVPRHELENLFFPLKIHSLNEGPMLLSMNKRMAKNLIGLPDGAPVQDSLFNESVYGPDRSLRLNNLTYSYPVGMKSMRPGLPILFYVNRVGAVGTGRIEEYYLDEPGNLYNILDEMGFHDPEDVREHAASSGPRAGKVLLIRFAWYRSFKRSVSLKEIRGIDHSFNPQRMRFIPSELFESVLTVGNNS
ncbi:hypothetical protein ACFL2Q_12865 [Thermodesulfobacteriota bacterium]